MDRFNPETVLFINEDRLWPDDDIFASLPRDFQNYVEGLIGEEAIHYFKRKRRIAVSLFAFGNVYRQSRHTLNADTRLIFLKEKD